MSKSTLPPKQMFWKFMQLAGISGAIFLGGLIVVLLVSTWVFKDRIQALFLENINKSLRTQVQVEGIRLDLLNRFPNASLTFSNVCIYEAGSATDTLAQAKHVFLRFNLWDLLRKNYTVKQIELSQARIRPVIRANGDANYLVWETSSKDQQAEKQHFSISLQRLIFNQVAIEFEDLPAKSRLLILTDKIIMSGLFSEDRFDLTAKGSLMAREINLGNSPFVTEKPLELDIAMQVNQNREFIFRKGALKFNNHSFTILGNIIHSEKSTYLDTRISGENLNLQTLLEDLPPVWKKYTDGYRAKGNLMFGASLQGNYSPSENPHIEASFSLQKAELHHRQSGLRLTNLGLSGSFDNGKARDLSTSVLLLSDLQTNINRGHIKGRFSIKNFHHPDIDFNLNTDADAADLVSLLRLDNIRGAKGNIRANLAFSGRMSQQNRFTSKDIGMAKASGTIELSQVGFLLASNPLNYQDFNGTFHFSNSHLTVETFSGKVSSSDFQLRGTFRNILPYILLDNEKLHIDARLISQNLNFDELFQQESQGTDTTYRMSFSEKLGFNLEAEIGQLNFRKFNARQIRGNVSMHNQRFYANNLLLNAMDGQIRANGFIDGTRNDYMTFGCEAQLRQVDIHQLFFQMGNFGQTSILDENIYGTTTSEFQFSGRWSPQLDVDWNSLEVTANVRVDNGVLLNYPPMIELSRFLRVGDLDRVVFSTLENQIRIKDRRIIIPEMEIKSSALNLNLSGQHTFEQQIDYRLQVLLKDLLARKNRISRNPQEQYGDIIDDGLGITLFLAVTGTTDDPVFRYDTRGVREKLRTDLRNERQNLIEVLRTEFSRQPKDTTAFPNQTQTQSQRRRENLRRQEKGEFVIEWEEK